MTVDADFAAATMEALAASKVEADFIFDRIVPYRTIAVVDDEVRMSRVRGALRRDTKAQVTGATRTEPGMIHITIEGSGLVYPLPMVQSLATADGAVWWHRTRPRES